MNYSDIEKIRPQIYKYLGFYGVEANEQTDLLIAECISKLEKTAQFNYMYNSYEKTPDFLQKEPYIGFLQGAGGVILCAMTLGIQTDKLIERLFRTDMSKAVVMDACASAYLEYLSDGFEKTLGDDLSFRFCPGYGGSTVEDLKYIFELIHPEKIGITLSKSNFMLPAKSMAGIIAIGKKSRKSCKGCIMLKDCKFLNGGTKCYEQTQVK